jgi:hypothetical protein
MQREIEFEAKSNELKSKDTSIFALTDGFLEKIVPWKIAITEVELNL